MDAEKLERLNHLYDLVYYKLCNFSHVCGGGYIHDVLNAIEILYAYHRMCNGGAGHTKMIGKEDYYLEKFEKYITYCEDLLIRSAEV